LLFNSFQFLVFFPIVCLLFFSFRKWGRWILLLASYYFYMCWKPEYLILILVSTAVDYFVVLRMDGASSSKRRWWLALSLATNLGILFFFKYFNFLNDSVARAFDIFGIAYAVPGLDILLPVGISFYTFQTLSYTIDVYRGARGPERSLTTFALYVAFFPQLVAGPIERSTHLLPQLAKQSRFDYDRVVDGLRLMIWGFVKKVVIADNLAGIVETVYSQPQNYTGMHLLIATYFFAFQIYCDFSGYSDIAIGAARVLGYDLMENFRRPYFSRSIREFWSRWHISLSTWFRDYVYIPLGGNRVTKQRWYTNLLIVFVVSGIWHGANWTFAVWGLLHGIYLVFALYFANIKSRMSQLFFPGPMRRLLPFVQVFITFHLVLISWVFFRAANLNDALYILTHIPVGLLDTLNLAGLSTYQLKVGVAMICLLLVIHLIQEKVRIRDIIQTWPRPLRWAAYMVTLFFIEAYANYSDTQFLYFQF